MISWRPVPDISAPIRIIHLNVDELGAERREALAAPYFLILWREGCPIAQFKTFCSSEPPLDWRMVERACEALTEAPTPQASRSNISLVICTRDRPQDLDRCLASLPSQNRRPDQVVVVDRQGLRRLAGRRTASTCLWLDEVRGCIEGFSTTVPRPEPRILPAATA
jgi:hypothetical protein